MPTDAEIADALAASRGTGGQRWRWWRYRLASGVLDDVSNAIMSAQNGGESSPHIRMVNGDVINRTIDLTLDPVRLEEIVGAPWDFNLDLLQAVLEIRVEETWYQLPAGLFRLNNPARLRWPGDIQRWQLTGDDIMSLVLQAKTSEGLVVEERSNYMTAIATQLTLVGVPFDLPDPGWLTPSDLLWAPFTQRLQICNDLAFGVNHYNLYADRFGVVRTRERVPAYDAPVDMTYSTITPPLMVDAGVDEGQPYSETFQVGRFPNVIVLTVDDPDRPAFYVKRLNGDPDSPISYTSLGGGEEAEIPEAISGDRVVDAFGVPIPPPAELPLTQPGQAVLDVAWHPSGNWLACALSNSPFVAVYEVLPDGWGARLADPAVIPTGRAYAVAWSPDGSALAVGHQNSPFVSVYAFAAGAIGAKYANPGTLPPDTVTGVRWNPAGTAVVMSCASAPFVRGYPWTLAGGFGAAYADPAGPIPESGCDVHFSPDGAAVGVAHNGAQTYGATIYAFDPVTGFGGRYPIYLTGIQKTWENGTWIEWSPDGRHVALATQLTTTTARVLVYTWDAATGTGNIVAVAFGNLDNSAPSSAMVGTWHPSGDYIAMGAWVYYNSASYFPSGGGEISVAAFGNIQASSEGFAVYQFADTMPVAPAIEFMNRLQPWSLLLGSIQAVAFSPDGTKVALGNTDEPWITLSHFQGGNVMKETADFELSVADAQATRAELRTFIDPRREPHEIYRVVIGDREGNVVVDQRYYVESWDYACEPGAQMLHNLMVAHDFEPEDPF